MATKRIPVRTIGHQCPEDQNDHTTGTPIFVAGEDIPLHLLVLGKSGAGKSRHLLRFIDFLSLRGRNAD